MNQNNPNPKDWPSIKDVLRNKIPDDPIASVRWKYLRLMIFLTFIIPVTAYGAYAWSVFEHGYQPFHKVGFWGFTSRLFILNAYANVFGLMLIIFILMIIGLPLYQRRFEKRIKKMGL